MVGLLSRFFGNGKAARAPRRGRGPSFDVTVRNQKIRDARQEGATVKSLMSEYGLGRGAIYKAISRISPPVPATPTPTNDRDVAITVAYEQGENSQALAEKYGVSRERICQILRRTNVIEHRAERRAAVQQTITAEVAQLKAAAKSDFDQTIAAGVELVRGGASINEAGRAVGLQKYGAGLLARACKQAGVKTQHGRWRDRAPKVARARALREDGKTWSEISAICETEGFGPVNPTWVSNHLPDLVTSHRTRRAIRAQAETDDPAPQPRAPRLPRPQEFDWRPEAVARLIDLWFGGSTAQQCADVMGPPITRNSIIGKINRLRAAGELKRARPLD